VWRSKRKGGGVRGRVEDEMKGGGVRGGVEE
jgi:hypothetical protein